MGREPRELWEPEVGGFSETPDRPSGLRGGEGTRQLLDSIHPFQLALISLQHILIQPHPDLQ
ncbi:hypothetical protein Cadr_000011842 [Camelus dromedarius]|uniref:Uncharacterized protein n=1 Tax=Camelus dromedarius TaxID=9838 RepID=A0A5N4DUF9_CAMDR|nr:hypothetical protein Cadr_000011842 [Camelus dromedarius]